MNSDEIAILALWKAGLVGLANRQETGQDQERGHRRHIQTPQARLRRQSGREANVLANQTAEEAQNETTRARRARRAPDQDERS